MHFCFIEQDLQTYRHFVFIVILSHQSLLQQPEHEAHPTGPHAVVNALRQLKGFAPLPYKVKRDASVVNEGSVR